MIFSFNENGDLEFDKENGTLTNVVIGDQLETDYKMSRTILLTHFIFKHAFKEKFIKNKRNIFDEKFIKEFLNKELDIAFTEKSFLRKYINYYFSNEKETFIILFFMERNNKKRILLKSEVKI